MKKMIGNITGGYGPSARVVDGTLILSLPDAISPIVWRLDLSTVKSSALEVQEQDGRHVLVIRTAKGERTEVAPYDSKAKALAALMSASHALENSHGQMRPANESPAPLAHSYAAPHAAQVAAHATPGRTFKVLAKAMAAGVAIVLLVILIGFAANVGPKRIEISGMESGASQTSAPMPGAPARAGVPVSADSFLQGRQ